MLYSELAGQN